MEKYQDSNLIPLLLKAANLLSHMVTVVLLLCPPVCLVLQPFPQLGPLLLRLSAQLLLLLCPAVRLLAFVARHGQLALHAHKVLATLRLPLVSVSQLLQGFC